jgi:hypothetical protein
LNGVNEVMYAPGFIEQGCLPGEGYVFDMHKLQWMPVPYIPQRKCKHLWRSLSFDNDGALFPCDIAFREEDVLVLPPRQGNWLAITELWNVAPLVETRYHFMGRQRRGTARGLCARCPSSW